MKYISSRLFQVLLTCLLISTLSMGASAGIIYEIQLTGDRTVLGSLEWEGDLSIDGAFARQASDISVLSIIIDSNVFGAADLFSPSGSAEYEVLGGELVLFDATMINGDGKVLLFGVQNTGDGGLSSSAWRYGPDKRADLASGTYSLTRSVPEPSSLAILGLGMLCLGSTRRRKARLTAA